MTSPAPVKEPCDPPKGIVTHRLRAADLLVGGTWYIKSVSLLVGSRCGSQQLRLPQLLSSWALLALTFSPASPFEKTALAKVIWGTIAPPEISVWAASFFQRLKMLSPCQRQQMCVSAAQSRLSVILERGVPRVCFC